MVPYRFHTKHKKRHSISIDTPVSKNSSMTIEIKPFSNLYTAKYFRNITTIPIEDDEELMKSETSLKFCAHDTIELRLEQDSESIHNTDDENDN